MVSSEENKEVPLYLDGTVPSSVIREIGRLLLMVRVSEAILGIS